MNDPILASFLDYQYKEAMELADRSDILDIVPIGPEPYQQYTLHFSCKTLVHTGDDVAESDYSVVAVRFPDDYLRRANPVECLAWLRPMNAFHPAIEYPFICPGRMAPSESLVELIYQCFDIITWRKVNMSEYDALNRKAAAWARANQDRFPIDPRPLVRRSWNLKIKHLSVQSPDTGESPGSLSAR